MKNCRNIQEELSAYIDRELSTTARAIVEEHLHNCSVCRQHLAELERIAMGTTALPSLQPEPGFLAEVRRRIGSETQARPNVWQNYVFRPWWLKVPLEAVAVIAIAVLVMRVGHWSNERSRPEEKQKVAAAAAEAEPRSVQKLAPTRLVGRAAAVGSQTETTLEKVVVYSKDFAVVQNRVQQLVAAINGRIVPSPFDQAPTHTLFVELPTEKVDTFKSQLQTASSLGAIPPSSNAMGSNSVTVAEVQADKATTAVVLEVQVLPPAD